MSLNTPQLDVWSGKFGVDYANRQANAVDLVDQRRLRRNWGTVLARAVDPEPDSFLEVGSNIGRNLIALQGFAGELSAVEPNAECCEVVRANPELFGVEVHCASAFELPFEDDSMDLVFTSGVLIHIAPAELKAATDEIHRVARHYVLAIEYFSKEPTSTPYRDLGDGFLFKRDFGSWYLDRFPDLSVVDYGFLWSRVDSGDDLTWWLLRKG